MDKKDFCDKYHLDNNDITDEEIKRIKDAIKLKKAQYTKQSKKAKPKFYVIIAKTK